MLATVPIGALLCQPARIVDLIPAYETLVQKEKTVSAQSFQAEVIQPNREVFEAVAARWLNPGGVDAFLSRLRLTKGDLEHTRALFRQRFELAFARFRKAFPGVKTDFPVFLLPAPRQAVGASVRPLEVGDALIFGSGELASVIDSQEAFDVLAQHELTHFYHMQVNPEMRRMVRDIYMPPFTEGKHKLYQVLWLEGLAVYSSKLMNPGANDDELVLSRTVASEVKAKWPLLGRRLRSLLDSAKNADIYTFLFDSDTTGTIPPRAGYYIGMLLAQELHRGHTIVEMCKWRGEQLRIHVGQGLDRLLASHPRT